MAWLKLDDAFADHPKLEAVGPVAGWLHVAALCYAARYSTDGIVPKSVVGRLANLADPVAARNAVTSSDCNAVTNAGSCRSGGDIASPPVAAYVDLLVEAGLWHDRGDHFELHDFLEYNPSKKTRKAQREATRRRVSEWRARKKAEKEGAQSATVTSLVTALQSQQKPLLRTLLPSRPHINPPSPRDGGTLGAGPPGDDPEVEGVVLRVLARMNELAGTTYTDSPDLRARILEGASEQDLLAVVESQWERDFMREKPSNFRPRTLFRAANFAEYLGAARARPQVRRRAPEEDGYRTVTLEDLQ